MKDKSIENRITEAFRSVTPDIKEEILLDLNNTEKVNKMEKGVVLLKTEAKPKKQQKIFIRYAALAACLLLMIGVGFGAKTFFMRSKEPVARVMIDVNPSIELLLNQKDKVIFAEAKNSDGGSVLAGMDLAGTDVKVAVTAVIEAMMKQGYLSERANSVLITVDSADENHSLNLRDTLCENARDYLQGSGLDCAILGQTLESGSQDADAAQYGISPGKALLIKRLLASNPNYDLLGLAALSINDLSLLCAHNTLEEVQSFGQPSDHAYIGREAAEEIALKHAGISRDDATKLCTELEYENGSLVYEVEFEAAGKEYEYDVDTITGEILKFEVEVLNLNENDDIDDPEDDDDDIDDPEDDDDDIDDPEDDDDDIDDPEDDDDDIDDPEVDDDDIDEPEDNDDDIDDPEDDDDDINEPEDVDDDTDEPQDEDDDTDDSEDDDDKSGSGK